MVAAPAGHTTRVTGGWAVDHDFAWLEQRHQREANTEFREQEAPAKRQQGGLTSG